MYVAPEKDCLMCSHFNKLSGSHFQKWKEGDNIFPTLSKRQLHQTTPLKATSIRMIQWQILLILCMFLCLGLCLLIMNTVFKVSTITSYLALSGSLCSYYCWASFIKPIPYMERNKMAEVLRYHFAVLISARFRRFKALKTKKITKRSPHLLSTFKKVRKALWLWRDC